MEGIVVRKVTESDFEQMFELWGEMQSFHEKWDEKWYKPEQGCKPKCFDYWRQKIKEDNSIMLVAEKGGDLAGMIISHIVDRPPVLESQFKVLFIDNVITGNKYRRAGIFKKLTKVLLELAKEKDVAAINLIVNTENEAAIKAYESLGMEKKEISMLKYL